MPFLDRGAFFARAFPSRSYVVSARIAEPAPSGMFINVGSPTRSLRSHPDGSDELLLVGGEGHHVGSGEAQPERYERLIEFARRHWKVDSIEHRWSAQDYSPDDGVPYVGPVHLRSRRVYVATGLKKWGITGWHRGGDADPRRDPGAGEPAGPSSSRRPGSGPLPRAPSSLWRMLRQDSTSSAIAYFSAARARSAILRQERATSSARAGRKVAGYRDEEGHLHAVSTRCTHLYCQVRWNSAERTWDCPCHGSRFTPDGAVLNGPAVRGLDPRPTR